MKILADARGLLTALDRGVVFTATDEEVELSCYPALACVHLAYDGAKTLTVCATERHIAVRVTLEVEPEEGPAAGPWRVLARREDARLITQAFWADQSRRVTRAVTLSVTVAAGRLTVTAAPTAPGCHAVGPDRSPDVSVVCWPDDQYPDAAAIFAAAVAAPDRPTRAGEVATGDEVSLAPALMSRLLQISCDPVRVRLRGDNRAAVVRIDDDTTALIMPVVLVGPDKVDGVITGHHI